MSQTVAEKPQGGNFTVQQWEYGFIHQTYSKCPLGRTSKKKRFNDKGRAGLREKGMELHCREDRNCI